MRNLLYRIATSLVLLPIIIACFVAGGIPLVALLGVVSALSCIEIAGIIAHFDHRAVISSLLFWGAMFLPVIFGAHPSTCIFFLFPMYFLVNTYVLFAREMDRAQSEKLSAIFFWCSYIVFAVLCLFFLVMSPHIIDREAGRSLVLIACIATWGNDTFAYFCGRLLGKTPLFARVSGKKTWEGFFGGAIGAFLLLMILYVIAGGGESGIFFGTSYVDILAIALPGAILAPIGDLIESRLKRFYDTKDSSNFLPGHGGVLDRIDALLLVLPWTAFYAFIIRPLW